MRKHAVDRDAAWWKVKDLETGTDIDDVIFADDETGEYDQFVRDEHGALIRDGDVVKTIRKQGRIKLYQPFPVHSITDC